MDRTRSSRLSEEEPINLVVLDDDLRTTCPHKDVVQCTYHKEIINKIASYKRTRRCVGDATKLIRKVRMTINRWFVVIITFRS